MPGKAIYFDTFMRTACKGCQVACKTWNSLPSYIGLNENKFSGSYQNPMDLRGDVRLLMSFNELEGGPKGVKWAFGRRSCQHCTDAGCVTMCPSGALYYDGSGMVTYNSEVCIGCQECSIGCPYNVPRYDNLTGKINKCTGCVDRINHNMPPACVSECQSGALQFGDRDDMIELANKRVKDLKERGYEDACVYGVDQMDGLHVIQVLKYGVEAHQQVKNPAIPAMVTATRIMKPVTGVVAALTGVGLITMFGMAVGYNRDERVYNEETGDTINVETGEVIKKGNGQDEESVKDHIVKHVPIFSKKEKGGQK